MTRTQACAKRLFDLSLACLGLVGTSWIIIPAYVLASVDTRSNGFFIQRRIGRYGRPFPLIKLRTMRPESKVSTYVTAAGDPRITRLGRVWRKTKIDELPQLINVLLGHMSFVGPRPDVPGYADQLRGEDRIILSVRPGITGPATLKYKHEEELLAGQPDPKRYNNEVIWPDKVALNKAYVQNYSLKQDLKYIWRTLV